MLESIFDITRIFSRLISRPTSFKHPWTIKHFIRGLTGVMLRRGLYTRTFVDNIYLVNFSTRTIHKIYVIHKRGAVNELQYFLVYNPRLNITPPQTAAFHSAVNRRYSKIRTIFKTVHFCLPRKTFRGKQT